jgi:flagellar FliJ protein
MRSRNTLIRMQRFLVDEKRRDVTQIEQMVADFETKQTELQSQIEAEQDSSGIFDVTHFAYPTFAKAAVVRRDNLKASIDGLQEQLEVVRENLTELISELKRLESLGECEDRVRRNEATYIEQRELDEVSASMHQN